MHRQELIEQIFKKKSFLCVGLDTDAGKIPAHLTHYEDPVFEFNKRIIDATLEYAVAFKPNTAFYESQGAAGWKSLEKTIDYLNNLNPKPFVIADAKRGDIGNTASQYAQAIFQHLNADAVTLSPYMGEDAIQPFLAYTGKWAIVLALTSNKGAADFQFLAGKEDGVLLYERVLEKAASWGHEGNIMFVAGATKAEKFLDIRRIVPDHFLLVPGIGAQGGSLEDVARYGMNKDCGLLVNASRSILYASVGEDFEEAAREEARKMQAEMAAMLPLR